MSNITLKQLYENYDLIIKIYDKFPTMYEQICHGHSELSEVYDAYRRPEEHHLIDFTDEICDTILSCIAMTIKGGIPIQQLNDRMEEAMKKNLMWARTARHNTSKVNPN